MAHLAPPPPRTMLGGTIHDTEASPPPTAHEVKDTARRASYNSSTRAYCALVVGTEAFWVMTLSKHHQKASFKP